MKNSLSKAERPARLALLAKPNDMSIAQHARNVMKEYPREFISEKSAEGYYYYQTSLLKKQKKAEAAKPKFMKSGETPNGFPLTIAGTPVIFPEPHVVLAGVDIKW